MKRYFARSIWLIFAASLAAGQQLNYAPFNKSGIYRPGEKAGWTLTLPPGTAAPTAKYRYQIKKNNFDTIQSGELDFKSGSATIETTLAEPTMLYVTVSAEGAPPESAIHLGAAIDPTELRPSAPAPPDFDAFWNAKIQNLSLVPLNPVMMPLETKNGVELSEVQVDCWGTRVHGYLAKPVKLGRFPALVIYQYAGVYALDPKTATDRAAEGWLTFDVDSHDLRPNQADGIPSNYQMIGNFNRETSYFLNMYLRDVRAVDYIRSLPDWDGRTIVLMGGSMGGQQSLVAAALRPQVSAVIVNEPAGADTNGDLHGRQAGYPNWPANDPRAMATALYFDIVNFAPRIKAPVLASVGFIDTTAPPAGIWTMLNQIRGPKEVVTMIDSDHDNRTPEKQGAYRARSKEVLDSLLHGGVFVGK